MARKNRRCIRFVGRVRRRLRDQRRSADNPSRVSMVTAPEPIFIGGIVITIFMIIGFAMLTTLLNDIGAKLPVAGAPIIWLFKILRCGVVLGGLWGLITLLVKTPRRLIFDDKSGMLYSRHFLFGTTRMPLSDVDAVVPVWDKRSGLLGKYYYYVRAYRKDLMLPAIRLTSSNQQNSHLKLVDRFPAIRTILDHHRPPPLATPRPEPQLSFWRSAGNYFYKLYQRPRRLFWRLIASNVMVLGGLAYVRFRWEPWVMDKFLEFSQEPNVRELLQKFPISVGELWDWVMLAVWTLAIINAFFTRVGLRLDPAGGRVSLLRGLGLWRTDYAMTRFRGFALLHPEDMPAGLYIQIDRLAKPLLLSGDKSPDRLRAVLLETAGILDLDPWANFATHPPAATPETANAGRVAQFVQDFPQRSRAWGERFEKRLTAFEDRLAENKWWNKGWSWLAERKWWDKFDKPPPQM